MAGVEHKQVTSGVQELPELIQNIIRWFSIYLDDNNGYP